MQSKTILLSPLDWGLGHASRLSEIANRLAAQGFEVIVAASGKGYWFFKSRYPQWKIYKVPALPLSYSSHKSLFYASVVWDFLKFAINLLIDRVFLQYILIRHHVDLIISDNRFGFFSHRIYSIIIAHHINILMPEQTKNFLGFGYKSKLWTCSDKLLHGLNCYFIRKFNQLWIPDFAHTPNLSGKLSHGRLCNRINTYYIGLLSRFKLLDCKADETFDIVCMVSGLEPHRTILVERLIKIFSATEMKVMILAGQPDKHYHKHFENISLASDLSDAQICSLIKGAKYLIVRGGYSTIMDLVVLKRTALLIPTPGQTEQEYLARYLTKLEIFDYVSQDDLNIAAIERFMKRAKKLEKNLLKFYA